ncbi:hypothetical protein GPALN_006367 [Globodera pallida]|nr:hypothetical protein GPALN_006367 [Globodera pallida]
MSDNISDEEQQQQMEEISICADVWLEVFACIGPLELGHLMALISDRFDRLVDEHFKTRKWSLGSLQIRRATDGNGAQIDNIRTGEELPIPQGPLPNKVIGFQVIRISYVDQTVIGFLQRIRRLFDSSGTSVAIYTSNSRSRSWEIIRQKIWPLINDNICHLFLDDSYQIDQLRQFSPTILRNCAKLRLISAYGLFPEFPAEDNADASSSQAAAKWLLTPREDGLPKMLRYCDLFFGKNGRTQRVIWQCFAAAGEHFDGGAIDIATNGRRQLAAGALSNCARRGKMGRVGEERHCQWNRIFINFYDWHIGDEMLDANDEGPSEPKK